MISVSKRFAIITSFFITQILVGLLIFYDTVLLLIISLLPACISLVYLRTTLANQKELTNESESKLLTPFAFFGTMIVSQVSIPIFWSFIIHNHSAG